MYPLQITRALKIVQITNNRKVQNPLLQIKSNNWNNKFLVKYVSIESIPRCPPISHSTGHDTSEIDLLLI